MHARMRAGLKRMRSSLHHRSGSKENRMCLCPAHQLCYIHARKQAAHAQGNHLPSSSR